jgi:hypothetical protein
MHRIGMVRVSRELAVEQRDLVASREQMVVGPAVAVERRRARKSHRPDRRARGGTAVHTSRSCLR